MLTFREIPTHTIGKLKNCNSLYKFKRKNFALKLQNKNGKTIRKLSEHLSHRSINLSSSPFGIMEATNSVSPGVSKLTSSMQSCLQTLSASTQLFCAFDRSDHENQQTRLLKRKVTADAPNRSSPGTTPKGSLNIQTERND